jgi:RNA processing factor Prp31
MLRYRAAAFFGRLYATEIMMGMQTFEEIVDVKAEPVTTQKIDKESERINLMIIDAETVADLLKVQPFLKDEHTELYETRFSELSEKEV